MRDEIRNQNMPLQFNPVKLFAGSGTKLLAHNIAKAYGKELGDCVLSRFSDGEFQPSYNESVRGYDVFLIQSTNQPNDNLVELLLMIDAAKRASAHYISLIHISEPTRRTPISYAVFCLK